MKSRVILYIALLFAAVLISCSKEDRYTPEPEIPEQEPEVNGEKTIAYTATVREGASTRASLDDNNSYIFKTGDRLYVTGENVYGTLNLI